MKKYINQILALGSLFFLAASCTDDTPVTTLQQVDFPAPIAAAPGTTLVLTQGTKNRTALTLSWTEPVYPIHAPVTYALQIDVPSGAIGETAWSKSIRVEAGEDVHSKSFTGANLNDMALELGLPTDVPGELAVRIEAYMDHIVYSQTLILTVTPFLKQIVTGEIYVPGAYNDWDFATAAPLTAIDNDIFQGLVNFPVGKPREFKFTRERNFNHFFGADAEGNFLEGGDVNLTVPNYGTYQITVDLNDMTYTAVPYSFAIVGTATAGGWDIDTDMAYDHIAKQWTITTALVSGALKFRLNNSWDVNYGPTNGNNGNTMTLGNTNAYTINEAGTYKVTFFVNPDPATATYSVTRIN
ncbi:hypothetical protein FNO01nite_25420 [Flavobacterium noncentrifugens]|uniref:SusE outer membrane protein n=1 Tax=Flavobacterium noncentrifugens TaxID=1128970 RepID=A0A1G8ZQK2_9FLAO|nr:SusE domain-containing protein [Flavobacterium noncentrifugens]GEP51870.1 hypothetical protein FNO01nite_25420 [Flavobacterium noncentrifugens]SDK17331.1 SusE outer membrane protein [Flavobacterium noncentrifugens]